MKTNLGEEIQVPANKKTVCKISHITDNTGLGDPSDMDDYVHLGFTIGKGKTLYWMIVWHSSGHCTVYRYDDEGDGLVKKWISGDTEITIHWK